MKEHIIGVFDSGVGGLTIMKEILSQIPEVRVRYIGDTARVPYGSRSKEELISFGEEICSFLIKEGAEVIVAACNTSSANALPVLKEKFDLPFIGTIEPGAEAAVKATKNGRIGLIATEATVRSNAYNLAVKRVLEKGILPQDQELAQEWVQGKRTIEMVKAQACPLFVPLVEEGLFHSPQAREVAQGYLAEIQATQVDTLILGCTHYPYLAEVIQSILGEEVLLVDPAQTMVEELKEVLKNLEGKAAEEYSSERHRFFVSGDPKVFRQVGNTLLPGLISHVEKVNW